MISKRYSFGLGQPTPGWRRAQSNLSCIQRAELFCPHVLAEQSSRYTNFRKSRPISYASNHSCPSWECEISDKKVCRKTSFSAKDPSVNPSASSSGSSQIGTVAHAHSGAIVAHSKSMKPVIWHVPSTYMQKATPSAVMLNREYPRTHHDVL